MAELTSQSLGEGSSTEKMVPVVLKTKTSYQIPSDTFMLPLSWRRYHLSQLINKVLNLSTPVPFDFIVNGELLSDSVGAWTKEKGVGEVRSENLLSCGLQAQGLMKPNGLPLSNRRKRPLRLNTFHQLFPQSSSRLSRNPTGCRQFH